MRLKKYIDIVCLISLIAMFLCPTNVFAANNEAIQFQEEVNTILRYTSIHESGYFQFDAVTATLEGVDSDLISTGEQLEAWSIYEYDASQGLARAVALPIYGNWCGPGYGGGDPIDALDAACKTHDECYGSYGWADCDCDLQLINTINSRLPYFSNSQKSTARLIVAYFTVQRAANGCE